MSVFTDAEQAYLQDHRLGRLATVGPDGQPHITPVTFVHNPDEDTIDIGGQAFGGTKKWRDATANPRVTFLVDDVVVGPPRVARAIEIRGVAQPHETGGDAINPRFPRFDPHFLRIRPSRIVAWGIEEGGVDGKDFTQNARDVG